MELLEDFLNASHRFMGRQPGLSCHCVVKILPAANLPADFEWAFAEHYTHPPARLMEGGRGKAGYYIIVKDGKITGGDGIPNNTSHSSPL